jgi:hypothetical protein
MMAAALLLGAGLTPALPGVSVRSAAAADESPASAYLSAGGTGLVRADDALALADIRPGDAVAYEVTSGAVTVVHVARQFWAIPSEG